MSVSAEIIAVVVSAVGVVVTLGIGMFSGAVEVAVVRVEGPRPRLLTGH